MSILRRHIDTRREGATMTGKGNIGAGLAALAALVLASPAAAQDEQPAPPETAQDAERDRSAPRRPAAGGEDDVFIPTEEIGADEEVVFPVDI